MDIRTLTPSFSVAPQIELSDIPAIVEAGFTTLICNRPDHEIPDDLGSAAMRAAAEAAGMAFHDNPVMNGAMTLENVVQQGSVAGESPGPVLAYCRSGTRSAIVWALSQSGRMSADEIVALAARAGYDIANMRHQLQDRYY